MNSKPDAQGGNCATTAAVERDRPWQSVTVSSVGCLPYLFPTEFADNHAKLVELMTEHWRQQIAAVLPDKPDLIVLPEVCERFFGTPLEILQKLRPVMFEAMFSMLADIARKNHCYIVYSAHSPVADGTKPSESSKWQNAAILIDRSGRQIARYNKNWLTPSEAARGIVKGTKPCVAQCDFGQLGFAICFDLNFHELLDAYRQLRPDLLIFPSNFHGGFMQQQWAYETRAHFVGCMGQRGINSEILSPLGVQLASSTNYYQRVTARLNLDCVVAHLDHNWEKLEALKARYGSEVSIDDPGRVGSVLISSRNAAHSAKEMAQIFEIELLDDYMARSRHVAAGQK